MSNLKKRNDLESGCLAQAAKPKKYSIFCVNNCSKIRTYTVLNTLPGDCNFEIFMFQNIISQSEHEFASEHLIRNKQKMSPGKKAIEEKQTILLKSMYRLR